MFVSPRAIAKLLTLAPDSEVHYGARRKSPREPIDRIRGRRKRPMQGRAGARWEMASQSGHAAKSPASGLLPAEPRGLFDVLLRQGEARVPWAALSAPRGHG
jgi:hypothetical protein